jgi:hypothetical protein
MHGEFEENHENLSQESVSIEIRIEYTSDRNFNAAPTCAVLGNFVHNTVDV